MITQEDLKQIINYNPETGALLWLKTTGKRIKKGNVAGSRDRTSGYRNLRINGKIYREHRAVWFYMYNEWPKYLDHINHIRDDNRLINLRKVTHQENLKNQKLNKKNTSGITGVVRDIIRGKWRAQIVVYYKRINLGRFDDKFEAICARKSAEIKHGFHKNHGINTPEDL